MLKKIPDLVNPELLLALAQMGHGDEIAVVDRNYPAYTAGAQVIHLDGTDTTQALDAVLTLLPLDTFVPSPLIYMVPVDGPERLEVHEAALACATRAEGREITMTGLDRHAFYERARSVSAVITTSESRPYGSFILIKGVIM